MYHYGNFSNMSRQMFHRYLVYYLTATAILICGSSQRTPRRAFCPSCSQDRPEALASPWYPRRGSDLPDFSVTPLQNSPYFRLVQREISQNIPQDDVLSSQNSISPKKYKSFSQQEPTSGYLQADRLPFTQFADKSEQQNSFVENFPNKFAEFLGKQTTLSLDKPVNDYPFVRASPSRQFFDESESKNSFFRSPRNKYSMFLSENIEDHTNQEDYARKFNVDYRPDMKSSGEDSRHIPSNEIVPRKFFPIFQQTSILDENKNEEEERNAIERFPNSVSQQYNLAFPQDRYHSVGLGVPKIQRESYVLSQNLDMQKSTKNDEVFGNWDFTRDSLETSSLGQLKSSPSNFFETYSMEDDEMITTKNDNEQIDYSYMSPQDSYTWKPTKDEAVFPDNWDSATNNDLQNFIEINQLKETENNWSQTYPTIEKDVRYFDDEKDKDREYFENKMEKNIQTGTSIYNPYVLPSNMNIWKTTQDRKLSDKLDFIIHRGLQEIQEKEPEIYSVKENSSNKYLQDKNKYTIQDETHIDTDRIIRAPVINITPYIFPQSLLNLLNALKYPVGSSITDLPETKNNILPVVPTEKRHERLSKDDNVILDDERNQDQIFIKDTYDAKKYNNHTFDRKPDIKNDTQNETLAEFDPDLIDEIENPPIEPTEPTPIEFFEKRPTSTAKENS